MAIKGTGVDGERVYWDPLTFSGLTEMTVLVWAKTPYFVVPAGQSKIADLVGKHKRDTPGQYTFFMSCQVEASLRSPGQVWFVQGFSTDFGRWYSTNVVVGDDILYHYGVTYDRSNVANDPIMYIDGVSVAVTEQNTPVGVATEHIDDDISILDILDSAISNVSNKGPIYSVCIYDYIFTPQKVKWAHDSYLAVPFADGLKFCPQLWGAAGGVGEGDVLVGANTIPDLVTGNLGTPENSPIFVSDNVLTISGHKE